MESGQCQFFFFFFLTEENGSILIPQANPAVAGIHKTKMASGSAPNHDVPYSCQPCNFVGGDLSALKKHEKSATHKKKMEQLEKSGDIFSDTKYVCRPCGYGTNLRASFEKHEASERHASIVAGNPTGPTWYTCEPCEYKTSKKRELERHKRTQKHKIICGK